MFVLRDVCIVECRWLVVGGIEEEMVDVVNVFVFVFVFVVWSYISWDFRGLGFRSYSGRYVVGNFEWGGFCDWIR